MSVLTFLSSTPGRWTRGIAGAILVALGFILGGWSLLLSVVGVVFIAVAALDVCLLAPLFHKPLSGTAFRASATHR
ncbi:hypothetical protein BH09ACT6_BH09ACT6_00980 [soil metagenome]